MIVLQWFNSAFSLCNAGAPGGISWTTHGHYSYLFQTFKEKWDDAKLECELQESHLVTIFSQDEQNFLNNMPEAADYWIGLKGNVSDVLNCCSLRIPFSFST